jgi:hypothetical protein
MDDLKKITDPKILKKQVEKIFIDQRRHVLSAIGEGRDMPTSYFPTKVTTEEKGEAKEDKSDEATLRKLIKQNKTYR